MTPITVRAATAAACALAAGGLATAPAPAHAAKRVDLRLTVRLAGSDSAGMRQQGTFAGRPFGKGTATVHTRLGVGRGASFVLDMGNRRGRVHGSGSVALSFRDGRVTYSGSIRITSGSGAFRGFRARRLSVLGTGRVTGDRFSVRIRGS